MMRTRYHRTGAILAALASVCVCSAQTAGLTARVGDVVPLPRPLATGRFARVGPARSIAVALPNGQPGLLIPDVAQGSHPITEEGGGDLGRVEITEPSSRRLRFDRLTGGPPRLVGTFLQGRGTLQADGAERAALRFKVLDASGKELSAGVAEPQSAQAVEWHGEGGTMGFAEADSREVFAIHAAGGPSVKVVFDGINPPGEAPAAPPPPCESIIYRGQQDDKYDLVFVGDGFRAQDQQLFQKKVQQVLNRMRSFAPYAQQFRGFNVWLLSFESNETGLDNEANGVMRDTVLSLAVDKNIPRMLVIPACAKKLVSGAIAAYGLKPDAIVIVSNDHWPAGGRDKDYVAVTISGEMSTIVTHELGHLIGNLRDEYDCYKCDPTQPDPPPGVGPNKCQINVTLDPVNYPLATNVLVENLFPGAWNRKTGAWRSEDQCHMRNRNSPFCKICDRALSQALEEYNK